MYASPTLILGGGMTGLALGLASGLPVYEAQPTPGGICSSYYIRPGDLARLPVAPSDGEAYRFEVGGGHWIFGGEPLVLRFIRTLAPVQSYTRQSSVYLPEQQLFIPYPIQNHLRYLGPAIAARVLREITTAATTNHQAMTMAEWLRAHFGPTLCELFFDPFHALYTAGLWRDIVPQDAYKSPVNLSHVIQGAFAAAQPVGYNATFVYPRDGLDTLARRLAERCTLHYNKRVTYIDVQHKKVHFADGAVIRYERLVSTLPLNRMMEMTRLQVNSRAHPAPSVFVVNIGARKGPLCPQDHWVYIPRSSAGFHRVGFYSNVDASFLPTSARAMQDRVSIYVEKAYADGQQPDECEARAVCRQVVQELQAWGWITETEVVDPTWINVAYTWAWVGSQWREAALKALERHDIYQVGRYARWAFQGIADSIRDGLLAGATLRDRDCGPT